MSYRSIKRVLGETSLERKCRFLFGACLLLLITASFWWYGYQTAELVYRQNQIKGQLLVIQVMIIRHSEELQNKEKKDENAPWTENPLGNQFLPVIQKISKDLSKQKYEWKFI